MSGAKPLLTIETPSEGFLEDRKSRFLAYLVPFSDFDKTLTALRAEHKKANHFVTAFRAIQDDDRINEGAKDDGEPAGTSGMPTLKVLQGASLINVGVIVVRYFGGTKLGGGGLARAYSGAASDAIAKAHLTEWVKHITRQFEVSFAESSKLEEAIAQLGVKVLTRDYLPSGVSLTLEGPEALILSLPFAASSRD